ncbi:DUF6901 family protein [Candidatus Neomarinimicrobiota bacterium]
MTDQNYINYKYTFDFEDGEQFVFPIALDSTTLELHTPEPNTPPPWARLDSNICDACPFQNTGRDYCPVASNLSGAVAAFSGIRSYTSADIIVESKHRTVMHHGISLQEGLGSLIGIIMVTSGCPDLDFLRPMVRFHLPFARLIETIHRSSANYLIAQFLRHRLGKTADWEMEKIGAIYKRIEMINTKMCDRLREATTQDAILNAIIVLDTSAQMMSYSFKGKLDELSPYFKALLSEP